MQIGCVQAAAVYHPLLLEPCLEPLQEPPTAQAVDYESFTGDILAAAAANALSWEPEQPKRQIYGRRGQPKGKLPCPIDLLVPPGAKVAAVTGPNTGMAVDGFCCRF